MYEMRNAKLSHIIVWYYSFFENPQKDLILYLHCPTLKVRYQISSAPVAASKGKATNAALTTGAWSSILISLINPKTENLITVIT